MSNRNHIEVRKSAKAGQPAASARTAQAFAESVPHSENGGALQTVIDNMTVTNKSEQYVSLVMTESGEVKQVAVRATAKGQTSIVDQVSFTFALSTLEKMGGELICSQEFQVSQVSELLEKIFGFGITHERTTGTDFYKRSFACGDFGQVGIGGQNDTCLVHMHGLGCLKALEGWEKRLYQFLKNDAERPKITRIDLAYDDFMGETVSVDWALEQYHEGGFTWTGSGPQVEQIGNWLKPNGKGRTFAVGTRTSGKYLRVYEKGRKEGCKESPWTRFEVELKSRDRVIPFDVLLDPSSYLAGTYPCAEGLHLQADRILTEKKTAAYTYEKMIEVTRTQMGRQLRFLKNFLDDSDEVLDLVMHPDPQAIPKRLVGITSGINSMQTFIHNLPHQLTDIEHIDFSQPKVN